MVQYSKFFKMAREVSWSGVMPSINYLKTSTWILQEHDRFSQQSSLLRGAVPNLKFEAARGSDGTRCPAYCPFQLSFFCIHFTSRQRDRPALTQCQIDLPPGRELPPEHASQLPWLRKLRYWSSGSSGRRMFTYLYRDSYALL